MPPLGHGSVELRNVLGDERRPASPGLLPDVAIIELSSAYRFAWPGRLRWSTLAIVAKHGPNAGLFRRIHPDAAGAR